LLNKHNIAFCNYGLGNFLAPRISCASFLYIRFHGGNEIYKSRYRHEELNEWKQWILKQNKKAYIYFNNTDEKVNAIENALELQNMLNNQQGL
jgi:uncharacterized protein YecE (DUF72 family)